MHQAALNQFLRFQIDEEALYRPLDEIAPTTPTTFLGSLTAFRDNLQSVVSTVILPAKITSVALEKLAARVHNLTSEQALAELADPALAEPASEQLRQGTVATWTALEVLASDLFVQLLNLIPDLAVNLMNDERTKGRFQLRNVPLETLNKFGYDVSGKMGALLVEKHAIDSAPVIRDVFDVFAPESEPLRLLLLNDRLWLLNQRRNLIVHRKAVVDEFYRSSTGENVPLNSKLDITLVDIQTDLELVRNIGVEMLRALPLRLRLVPVSEP